MAINPLDLKFKDGRQQVKVDDETGCWIWQGYCCRGYGRMRVGKRPSVQAHRALYERHYGVTVAAELDLGHKCNRRSCVNPEHVTPVTKPQNAIERYRMPTLGEETRNAIEEALLDDKPHSWICNTFCISMWSIRRIAEDIDWRNQLTLEISEVPF